MITNPDGIPRASDLLPNIDTMAADFGLTRIAPTRTLGSIPDGVYATVDIYPDTADQFRSVLTDQLRHRRPDDDDIEFDVVARRPTFRFPYGPDEAGRGYLDVVAPRGMTLAQAAAILAEVTR